MINKIAQFYSILAPKKDLIPQGTIESKYKRLRWSVFISATLGYSLYYVCRLSLSVIKKPLVDANILNESELGLMGSALFFSYAAGKLFNGFFLFVGFIKYGLSVG